MPCFKHKRGFALLCGAAYALASVSASAQANYQSYPIGERATGLGGAYVALSDDAAGPWYNPGGLAFAHRDSLSVSADLYGAIGADYPNALGNRLNYSYTNLNIIPSSSGALVHLGQRSRAGYRPVTVAFNLFNPATYQLDRRIQPRGSGTTMFVTTNDRSILAGPSVAWRINNRVGIGFSLLGSLHTFLDRVDLSDIRGSEFFQFTSSLESVALGLCVGMGVRVQLTDTVSLGISAKTPTISVWGEGSLFERTVRVDPEHGVVTSASLSRVESRRLQPGTIRAGMAWSVADRFAITGDFSLYFPLRYDAVIARTGERTDPYTLRALLNAAVGFETYASRTLAFRAGIFSDLSAAPTPLSSGSKLDQVDSIGLSVTGSLFSRGSTTTIGLVGLFGKARVAGVDVASGSYQSFVADGIQWRLYAVWAETASL
jgi:long-chain fatty acid transport protein